jgi:FAD binding domain/Berberine and berberine like
MMTSWRDALAELDDGLVGPSFVAGSPGYEDEVAVFNQVVVHRPAVVVGAVNVADVSTAVGFASRHGLDVGVVNTGHGPSVGAGASTVLITTRRMNGVEVDAEHHTARVAAGVRFGQLVEAAAAHGLAPLAGSAPGVGVVGYTLAGGASATMGRKYGWAADHVRALEVVTADGQHRRVTPQAEGELFGALLGGKSNFGVVTALECALFPVTHLYAGSVFFSGEHTAAVLEAYRHFTQSAPEQISTGVALLNLPPLPHLPLFLRGKPAVALRISYVGDPEAGKQLIAPLRAAAPVLMDTVTEIAYPQFGTITDDPTEPAPAVEHFALLRELTDHTIDAIVAVAGPTADHHLNIVDIRHLHGAYRRPAPFPNAVGTRDAAFALFTLTVVPPGHTIADYRDCGRELTQALTPWLHDQTHPGFLGPDDATTSRTRRAYHPDTYHQLQTLKTKYDPHNIFRTNHNIPPTNTA